MPHDQNNDNNEPEWRICPAAPAYEINNFGEIRRSASGHGSRPGRLLRPFKVKNYLFVSVPVLSSYADVGQGSVSLARLVAVTFPELSQPKPVPLSWQVVGYRDGDTCNVSAANLFWETKRTVYEENTPSPGRRRSQAAERSRRWRERRRELNAQLPMGD